MFRFHFKCKVSYNGFKCLEIILYNINNYMTTISVNLQHSDRLGQTLGAKLPIY